MFLRTWLPLAWLDLGVTGVPLSDGSVRIIIDWMGEFAISIGEIGQHRQYCHVSLLGGAREC